MLWELGADDQGDSFLLGRCWGSGLPRGDMGQQPSAQANCKRRTCHARPRPAPHVPSSARLDGTGHAECGPATVSAMNCHVCSPNVRHSAEPLGGLGWPV